MKPFIYIAMCGILTAAAGLVAAPASSSSDQQDVLAAMESFRQATLHKDGAALNKLFADDLTYVHSSDLNQNKAEAVKGLVEGREVTRLEFSGTTVRLYGNVALVKCAVDLWHGADQSHLDVLHVWQKAPGGWRMVARQAVAAKK